MLDANRITDTDHKRSGGDSGASFLPYPMAHCRTETSSEQCPVDKAISSTPGIVWGHYFDDQLAVIKQCRHILWPEYPEYLARLGWNRHELPALDRIDAALAPTGWTTAYVEGYESSSKIYELLAARKLPIARTVRGLEHVKYSPQPDQLHDLVGHVPFLFNADLARLSEDIARKALQFGPAPLDLELHEANFRLSTLKAEHSTDVDAVGDAQRYVTHLTELSEAAPSAFARAARLYLWVLEFGFLEVGGTPRAIGAALLSSRSDLKQVMRHEIALVPFSEAVFHQEVSISGPQSALFVLKDLDDVYGLLDAIRE